MALIPTCPACNAGGSVKVESDGVEDKRRCIVCRTEWFTPARWPKPNHQCAGSGCAEDAALDSVCGEGTAAKMRDILADILPPKV